MTSFDRYRDLVRAEFTEPGTGAVGRERHDHEPWAAPAYVELQDDCLIWDFWTADGERRPACAVGPDMLGRFAGLHEGTDAAIRDFATDFGALLLCEHSAPATHDPDCRPRGWPGPVIEPLAEWRDWSRRADAYLAIGARLALGDLGRANDWAVVFALHPDAPKVGDSVNAQRSYLAYLLDEWMLLGRATIGATWDGPEGLTIRTRGAGLFGALAVQFLLTLTRSDGLAFCAECGRPFPPKRRPSRSRRSFCDRCGNRAAQRQASRDYRERGRQS